MAHRQIPILLITLVVSVAPVAVQAALEGERDGGRDPVEERSPEPVPTPLFCTGVGSHSVCIPPW